MPKEYINDENYDRSVPVDGSSDPAERHHLGFTSVKLSWSKEGCYVQMAVVDRDKDPDGMEALHVSLDRDGLNRLVRFARRARDDSFGKDE